jgi:hypothetical protein
MDPAKLNEAKALSYATYVANMPAALADSVTKFKLYDISLWRAKTSLRTRSFGPEICFVRTGHS